MTATPRNAADRNARRTATPKLTPRGIRLVTALVFATVTVAVVIWGVWPVVGTAAAVWMMKRPAVAKMLPSAKQVLRGLSWAVAGAALLLALTGAGGVAGGAPLGVALSAALATYLYTTRRSR